MQKRNAATKQKDGLKPKRKDIRFRKLIESLPELVFEANLQGNITYANRSALQTFGYSQEDLDKGLNVSELFSLDQRDHFMESLRKLAGNEQIREELLIEEYTLQRKSGLTFSSALHINRILDGKGNIKGFMGILFNFKDDKNYREAFRESEEKLRFIIDSISDGILVIDVDGRVLEANRAILEKAGYKSKEEIIGQNAFDFIAQKDLLKFQQEFAQAMNHGISPEKVEYTLWSGEGKKFEAEISAARLHDSHNKIIGFIGVVRDITSRKMVEQTLRGREERLQAIVENAPDAIFIYDNTGTLTYGNRKAEELTGYSREEFAGKNIFDMGIVSEEYLPIVLEKIKLQMPGGPQEIELINKEGRHIFIEVTVFPVVIKGSVEFIGIARDITERRHMEQELARYRDHLEHMVEQRTAELTSANQHLQNEIAERKRAEEGLRTSEEKLRFIFETIGAGIIATDLEANITEINDAALKMSGYSREDILGRNGLDFLSPKDRSKILKDMKKIFNERRDVSIEYEVVDKDGTSFDIEISATLLHDSNGDPDGFIAIFTEPCARESADLAKGGDAAGLS